MSILTINAGSSSLRLSLFVLTDDGVQLLSDVHHKSLTDFDQSLLADFIAMADGEEIELVAHRVVHGGVRFTGSHLIDAAVEDEIDRLSMLAPLHNPPALTWIRLACRLLGKKVPQIAVFDTAFYTSLPQVAVTYALPQALCHQYNIRRYGFHGIAHRAILDRWCEINPTLIKGGRVISVQLGSGCSITAIDHGMPVDTSMGFSPLEGLVMATRSGDIDPEVITYLQRETGMGTEEISHLLNKQSGLLGLSGESGDMKILLNSERSDAELAVNLYCYRVRKYIGAYLAVLGGVDAILFGGGVGENSPQVRAKILQGMEWCELNLNISENERSIGMEAYISTTKSKIDVIVIKVDEAKIMAQEALKVM